MKPKASLSKLLKKSRDSFHRSGNAMNDRMKSLAKCHPLEVLAVRGDWESFEAQLGNYSTDSLNFPNGDTLLHMVCRFHPPANTVRKLFQNVSNLVTQVNNDGQLPLHVAAACGASYKVVKLLFDQHVDAALETDLKGNTPLHLHFIHCCGQKVCDPGFNVPNINSCNRMIPSNSTSSTASTVASSNSGSISSLFYNLKNKSNSLSASCHGEDEHALKPKSLTSHKTSSKQDLEQVKILVDGPTHEVVRLLAKNVPACLSMENEDELSIVELAIMYEADLKTVSTLQGISRSYLQKLCKERSLATFASREQLECPKIVRNAAA